MCALGPELLAHQETSLVQNILVPGTGGRDTSGEHADIVGDTVGEGTVLEAEAVEAETLDRLDVTNARTGHTSDHLSLLFQCQLSHEGLGPLVSFFPADASCVSCNNVSITAASALRDGSGERTRRHDRRGVSISSEDGGVQRLNVAEGIFVADSSIVSLGIGAGHQQRQEKRQEGGGGHCELLFEGSSKWLVSVHHRWETYLFYILEHIDRIPASIMVDRMPAHTTVGPSDIIHPYCTMPVPRLAHYVSE